jgi:hypothetical protein
MKFKFPNFIWFLKLEFLPQIPTAQAQKTRGSLHFQCFGHLIGKFAMLRCL